MLGNANIQIITLPRCHDKYQETQAHLVREGIYAQPFYGFDYQITGLETSWTYELDHPGSGYHIGPKMVSMHLSHYLLWKVLSYLPHDVTVILEDDVRFLRGWREHFDEGVTHLPDDWDLLYIGSCCAEERRDIQPVWGRLCKINHALCTHAYVVRKKALSVLLEHGQKVWTNIDLSIALCCMPHLQCFAFLPRLANQLDTVISP